MLNTDKSEVNKDESSNALFFRSATEVSDEEQKRERLSTGSTNIDLLLDGGIECGTITQFYGVSKIGKTHLCHQFCVVLPLHYKVIYIDTQDGFSITKIKSIAQARELSPGKILENIIVVKIGTTREQEQCIESLQNKINSESGVKLLIVDSMTHLYRAEFTERSQLVRRQSKMSKYLQLLLRVAQTNSVAVVITNEVHSNPQPYSYSDKLQPAGGNVLSYPCKYIVNLEDRGFQYRSARLEKSPNLSAFSVPLIIDNKGFTDENPFPPEPG